MSSRLCCWRWGDDCHLRRAGVDGHWDPVSTKDLPVNAAGEAAGDDARVELRVNRAMFVVYGVWWIVGSDGIHTARRCRGFDDMALLMGVGGWWFGRLINQIDCPAV